MGGEIIFVVNVRELDLRPAAMVAAFAQSSMMEMERRRMLSR